jgi:hypothetical protein
MKPNQPSSQQPSLNPLFTSPQTKSDQQISSQQSSTSASLTTSQTKSNQPLLSKQINPHSQRNTTIVSSQNLQNFHSSQIQNLFNQQISIQLSHGPQFSQMTNPQITSQPFISSSNPKSQSLASIHPTTHRQSQEKPSNKETPNSSSKLLQPNSENDKQFNDKEEQNSLELDLTGFKTRTDKSSPFGRKNQENQLFVNKLTSSDQIANSKNSNKASASRTQTRKHRDIKTAQRNSYSNKNKNKEKDEIPQFLVPTLKCKSITFRLNDEMNYPNQLSFIFKDNSNIE